MWVLRVLAFISCAAASILLADGTIPLAYYWFIVPGIFLALIEKRFEIPLLAFIPILGALVSSAFDHRMLMGIPFWIILMAFTIDWIWNSKYLRYKGLISWIERDLDGQA